MRLRWEENWEDGERYYDIFTSNGKMIACTWSLEDARLLTAAPELLEQLQVVLSELLIAWDKNQDYLSSEIIDQQIEIEKAAKAVIAQAKGVAK